MPKRRLLNRKTEMVRIAEHRAQPGAASRGAVYSAESATVMSRPAEDRATVDAGLTAQAFDSGPALARDEPAARYVSGGGFLATGNASLTRNPGRIATKLNSALWSSATALNRLSPRPFPGVVRLRSLR
jgi:hypothetical protein